MKKLLLLFISIYLSLIIFMPKEELLYTAINKLNPNHQIELKIDNIKDYGIFLKIDSANIYYENFYLGNIGLIKIFPLIFYNQIKILSVELSNKFKKITNLSIFEANIIYHIFDPKEINLTATTNIGKIKGRFNLKNFKLSIFLTPNKNFNHFKYKHFFKKQGGGYIYELFVK